MINLNISRLCYSSYIMPLLDSITTEEYDRVYGSGYSAGYDAGFDARIVGHENTFADYVITEVNTTYAAHSNGFAAGFDIGYRLVSLSYRFQIDPEDIWYDPDDNTWHYDGDSDLDYSDSKVDFDFTD